MWESTTNILKKKLKQQKSFKATSTKMSIEKTLENLNKKDKEYDKHRYLLMKLTCR